MALVTVTEYVETTEPTMEVAILEASDGEIYHSHKFGRIIAAVATINMASGDLGTPVANAERVSLDDAHFSDGYVTVEFKGTATTDIPVSIILFGE